MTKTFENGPHAAAAAPSQSQISQTSPAAAEAPSSKPPLRSKAVYNAVCTTSTSTSGAVLMSPTENHSNTNSLAEEDSVTNLDELKLRALLDEAITYKTPKDREGKSKLFNTLLIDAEDDLRKEHAHNASGPARHFSSTAKKRHRQRRQPSSVSENLTHGGSLNDLAKQELYEYESAKAPRPKTVSTRQREGGSLPCNVNAGAPHVDKAYFMEERARQQEQRSLQSALGIDYPPMEPASTFITQASIPITANKVDDALSFAQLTTCSAPATQNNDGTPRLSVLNRTRSTQQQFSLINHPKKLDENDNAVVQNSSAVGGDSSTSASACAKRKSKQKKPENVITAKDIKGHRSDIIENIDKLVSYIEGTEDKAKKKLHKQHSHTLTEDKTKKRTRKKSATMLHKSNSMEEMSTTKLEDFACRFEALDVKEKAPLRPTKSNVDRPSRLHKGWVVSSEHLQTTSVENVEIADFIYVTKKKKSKKRRNSLGSRGNPPQSELRPAEFHSLRVSSPRRRKSASEKSADSSDNESVHSLPLDGDGDGKSHQISYADIAKNSERPKWNRLPSERRKNDLDKKVLTEEKIEVQVPATQIQPQPPNHPHTHPVIIIPNPNAVQPAPVQPQITTNINSITTTTTTCHDSAININATLAECNKDVAKTLPKEKEKETDTDLSSLQNWPEIRNNKVNQTKNVNASVPTMNSNSTNSVANNMVMVHDVVQQPVQDWPSIISNGANANANVKPTTKQQQQQQQAQPKQDNKQKKNKVAVAVPQQPQTEHLQQVLQVQVQSHSQSNPYLNPVYRYEQDLQQEERIISNPQQVIQQVSEQSHLYQMPPNIRDVQAIEEMQMRLLQATPAAVVPEEESCPPEVYVPCVSVSAEKYRPAVVILSSGGDRHSTSDITFGFGINEQLLSGDVCADFVSRFLQPEVSSQVNTHVDQLVNYVGSDWEDILMQAHTGKVKYYTDELS